MKVAWSAPWGHKRPLISPENHSSALCQRETPHLRINRFSDSIPVGFPCQEPHVQPPLVCWCALLKNQLIRNSANPNTVWLSSLGKICSFKALTDGHLTLLVTLGKWYSRLKNYLRRSIQPWFYSSNWKVSSAKCSHISVSEEQNIMHNKLEPQAKGPHCSSEIFPSQNKHIISFSSMQQRMVFPARSQVRTVTLGLFFKIMQTYIYLNLSFENWWGKERSQSPLAPDKARHKGMALIPQTQSKLGSRCCSGR